MDVVEANPASEEIVKAWSKKMAPPLVTLLPSFASTLSQTKVRRDARAGVSGTVTCDRDRRDSRGCSCRHAR